MLIKNEYWENTVKEVFGKETKIIFPKFFFSKKNQVTLLTLKKGQKKFQVIAKHFSWGDLEKEKNILLACKKHQIPVPEIVAEFERILFLQNIPGQTLETLLKSSSSERYLIGLAKWLAAFHTAFLKRTKTMIKGDVRFGNFLWYNDIVWGIDFEESQDDRPEVDLADLYASLWEDRTDSCEKKRRWNIFLTEYKKNSGIKLKNLQPFIIINFNNRCLFREDKRQTYQQYIAELGTGDYTDQKVTRDSENLFSMTNRGVM